MYYLVMYAKGPITKLFNNLCLIMWVYPESSLWKSLWHIHILIIKVTKSSLFLVLQIYENDRTGCESWITRLKRISFWKNQTKIHFKRIFTLDISMHKWKKSTQNSTVLTFLEDELNRENMSTFLKTVMSLMNSIF